ncbi:RDD family protein [Luteolibacter marinus]|uniref:RDD family protein n=1 Tax=Luteolibacter marinus TaxID=2776705 RepID=UPI001865A476
MAEEAFVTPGGGTRFLNLILDLVAIYGLIFVVAIVLAFLFADQMTEQQFDSLSSLIGIGTQIGYYTLTEGLFGRTLGKLITGCKVVDAHGGRIGLWKSFLRSLCRFIPFEPFSFLGSDARGWHDSITKTWVIKSR